MHELYITESIIKTVIASLPSKISPEMVTKIQVQVGKLDAVVPDTLLFLFNAVKTSSGLINAELNLEEVEIRALCQQCHNEFEIDLPLFICPACGSGQVKVLQGRGIILQRIIADETQGVEVGNSSNS